MKKYVGTIILLIVAIGLGIYVLKMNKAPLEESGSGKVILNLEREAIEAIAVLQKDKDDIVILRETDNKWKVIGYRADINAVNGLLSELEQLKAQRSFTPKSGNLEDFGLKAPESVIEVKTDEEQHKLLIGEKNVNGTAYFVMLSGNEAIYTVQGMIIEKFLRESAAFRDRRVLDFDAEKVNAIRLYEGRVIMEARKRADSGWGLLQPVRDKANEVTIGAIIKAMQGLKAAAFVTDDLIDLKEYGINPDSPQKYAELVLEGKNNRIRLLVGGRNEESGNIYVKNKIGYSIYEVSPAINDNFSRTGIELRYNYPLDYDTETITTVRVESNGMEIACSRTDDVGWEMSGLLKTDCSEIIPRLLSKIRYSTINDYSDTGAAPGPLAVIQLDRGNAGPPLILTVEDRQADGTLYVKSSQRNSFMNIDGSLADVIRELTGKADMEME